MKTISERMKMASRSSNSTRTKGIFDTDKADKITACLGGDAFDFYFERLTMDEGPAPEAKD